MPDISQRRYDDSLPVVSTCGEMRRNTGRAYGGRARWIFCKKPMWSKLPAESAMAAMPALPSTPGIIYGNKYDRLLSIVKSKLH